VVSWSVSKFQEPEQSVQIRERGFGSKSAHDEGLQTRRCANQRRSTVVWKEVPELGTEYRGPGGGAWDGEFEPVRDGVPESTATTGNRKASYCSRLMDASELTTPL